ncbi:MAG: hypothetical protein ACRCWR_08700, partial [Saezia sp.]
IQIHDAGHIVNGSRDTHAKDAYEILSSITATMNAIEMRAIFSIARAHGGATDLIGELKKLDFFSDVTSRC